MSRDLVRAPAHCTRCGRELHPWPIRHPSCSPAHWVRCISTDPMKACHRDTLDTVARDAMMVDTEAKGREKK